MAAVTFVLLLSIATGVITTSHEDGMVVVDMGDYETMIYTIDGKAHDGGSGYPSAAGHIKNKVVEALSADPYEQYLQKHSPVAPSITQQAEQMSAFLTPRLYKLFSKNTPSQLIVGEVMDFLYAYHEWLWLQVVRLRVLFEDKYSKPPGREVFGWFVTSDVMIWDKNPEFKKKLDEYIAHRRTLLVIRAILGELLPNDAVGNLEDSFPFRQNLRRMRQQPEPDCPLPGVIVAPNPK